MAGGGAGGVGVLSWGGWCDILGERESESTCSWGTGITSLGVGERSRDLDCRGRTLGECELVSEGEMERRGGDMGA